MPVKPSNNRLEILSEIAQGGQSRVFLARALSGRFAAIKFFFDPEIFKREVFYLNQIDHSLITRFLGILDSENLRGSYVNMFLGLI